VFSGRSEDGRGGREGFFGGEQRAVSMLVLSSEQWLVEAPSEVVDGAAARQRGGCASAWRESVAWAPSELMQQAESAAQEVGWWGSVHPAAE